MMNNRPPHKLTWCKAPGELIKNLNMRKGTRILQAGRKYSACTDLSRGTESLLGT